MALLVDVGNTRIKWVFSTLNQDIPLYNSCVYKSHNLDVLLTQIWGNIPTPSVIYIANVGSHHMETTISNWVALKWKNVPLHFIKPAQDMLGIKNGYKNPLQLGVDRWLGLIAAYNLFKNNICVFDCGTAITADVVTISGQHLGGLIFPGITLLQTSLIEHTEGCASISLLTTQENTNLLADNTEEGIMLASRYGAAAFMEKLEQDLINKLQINLQIVITGGDAEFLFSHLPHRFHYIPDLVLRGLKMVAESI